MRGHATLSERIYRAALRLYPGAFRREFAREMALDFDEAGREAWQHRGWHGLLAFWGRMTADFTGSVTVQWMRTGLPLITLVSALVAAGVTGAAAQIAVRGPIVARLTPEDNDLLLMMLLIAVVLSVIVATLVFTVWFARPFPRRRRS
jgi:hypothetical protein